MKLGRKMYGAKPFPAVHRQGLPIADGTAVTIDMLDKRYMIRTGSGDSWDLAKEKVTNVQTFTEKEVQTHLKNRPGMALLGGATLGIIGAVAGAAMTKEKRSVVRKMFLVIDYTDRSGSSASLVFQYDDPKTGNADWQKPAMFVKDFQSRRASYSIGTSHVL